MKKDDITEKAEKKFITTIKQHQLIDKDDHILLGVSGGSDSMALLHLFAENFRKTHLVAIYIDHGLRKDEAKKECRAIKEICHQLKISFGSKKVDVYAHTAAHGLSIEESARILRYKTFRKYAQQCSCKKIAVAHTSDDQVENFFIRLIRGAGACSAKGMQYRHGDIIRPLLGFKKKELQEYLLQQKISWFEDFSNNDPAFLRNRVRLQLLPLLKKDFSPSINKQVLQFMQILGEENDFLAQEVEKFWQNLVKKTNIPSSIYLKTGKFSKMHRALQRRIIEKCIVQMQGTPSFIHIEQIIQLAERALEGNCREIHLADGLRVEKRDQEIIFHRPLPTGKKRGSATNNPACFYIEINSTGSYQLPENSGYIEISLCKKREKEIAFQRKSLYKTMLYLDADKAPFPLLLRPALKGEGERFSPCNGTGSKKITRYFSDKKIPQHKRGGWPLLCRDNQIAAIVGLEIDDRFKITEGTNKVLTISLSP